MRAVVFAYSSVGDRCLRVLSARGVDVSLVITHRDRPEEHLWYARVSETAAELGLRCRYADDCSPGELKSAVAAARPDVIFSFYYRALLGDELLAMARLGAFNMHGSLLPRYRGRAPTNWAVLHGESETGATLHHMVARADAGDIVDSCRVPILPDDTARQVFDKVTVAAEIVLWRTLPAIAAGTAPRRVNDPANGSYFGVRTPEDGRIDWQRSASEIYNLIRAVAPPYPGAFTEVAGVRLVVADARLSVFPASCLAPDARPGLAVIDGRVVGICGDGRRIEVRSLLAESKPVGPDLLADLVARARRGQST